LILVIIFFFNKADNFIFCQELPPDKSYGLSIGASFGSIFGNSLELVYPVYTKGEYLSELIWEMNPVFYFDLNIDFKRNDLMSAPGFFSSVSFKIGIPGYSGIHQNRDWMSTENSDLTHFSSHKNMLRDFYSADAVIGLSIPVRSWFYVTPLISGSWMHFAFSGVDGSGKYARLKTCNPDCSLASHTSGCTSDDYSSAYYPIDYFPHLYSFSGEVIRYKQDWFLAAFGFNIGTEILHPFLFEFSFLLSPFTYCAAVDEHLERGIVFNDYTAWGFYIEPKGHVSYVSRYLTYSLGFSYKYIGRTKGSTYVNEGFGFYKSYNEAGAGLSFFDISFSLKIRI